jgi:hypothetical protein
MSREGLRVAADQRDTQQRDKNRHSQQQTSTHDFLLPLNARATYALSLKAETTKGDRQSQFNNQLTGINWLADSMECAGFSEGDGQERA